MVYREGAGVQGYLTPALAYAMNAYPYKVGLEKQAKKLAVALVYFNLLLCTSKNNNKTMVIIEPDLVITCFGRTQLFRVRY